MKFYYSLLLLFVSNYMFAQLFESQITNSNPAYTGMQDERFGEISGLSFPIDYKFGLAQINAGYQQNIEKINSGIGVSTHHTFYSTKPTQAITGSTTLNGSTSLRYRYAYRFENGLAIAAGTRISHSYHRFQYFDTNSDFREDFYRVGFGTMMSYNDFTIGLITPSLSNFNHDQFKFNKFWGLNSSYKKNVTEKIELTAIWTSFFTPTNNRHVLRVKSEFNQKFWFSTGFITFTNPPSYTREIFYGCHFGLRIKNNYHIFLGSDLQIARTSFNALNPQIGFIYQFNRD